MYFLAFQKILIHIFMVPVPLFLYGRLLGASTFPRRLYRFSLQQYSLQFCVFFFNLDYLKKHFNLCFIFINDSNYLFMSFFWIFMFLLLISKLNYFPSFPLGSFLLFCSSSMFMFSLICYLSFHSVYGFFLCRTEFFLYM